MSRSDFLIIGGGIAGISVAAELSRQGGVTLLEAEDSLAWHASGRSAALYAPWYGPPPIIDLSLASEDSLEAAGVLSDRGLMLVAPVGETDGFDEALRIWRLEEIDARQAVATCPALEPAILGRAGYAAYARDIDTDRLIQSCLRRSREGGARILTRARVGAVWRQNGLWVVQSAAGEHAAPVLVNAAGAWADGIARMAGVAPLGIQPFRRSMARIPTPGGHDASAWPMVVGHRESWYAKPDAGALIVSPADRDPVPPQDAWADDMVLAEGLARYAAMMRFPVERLIANWAGLRSFAPDGMPVYGRDGAEPDFIWFAGQGGYGFQSAPAAARFIADLIGGRPVDAALAAAMDPRRPIGG